MAKAVALGVYLYGCVRIRMYVCKWISEMCIVSIWETFGNFRNIWEESCLGMKSSQSSCIMNTLDDCVRIRMQGCKWVSEMCMARIW